MARDSKRCSEGKRIDRFVRRRRFLGGAAATGALALAGCLGGDDDDSENTQTSDQGGYGDNTGTEPEDTGLTEEQKMGGTLRWGGAVPVQTLDPHLETAAASARVFENVYEGLVQLNYDLTFSPHLASSMETSEDNTTLSFELEQGVTFHDGSEMTSADVMASLERVRNNEAYISYGFMQNVESMAAPGDYQFEIDLAEPFAPFIAKLSTAELAILPESEAAKDEITEPVGTGPFQYESREIESSITLSRFDDYWNDEVDGPYLDEVVKSEITDPSVRLQSFRAGEYDFINGIPPREVEQVRNDPGVNFESIFPKALVYLGLNCNEAPFDDKHARLALDYSFSKQDATEAALYGTGQATATPAPPGSPWEHPDIEPRPRDLEQAQQHLDQAGLSDGFSVSFKIPQSYPAQVQAAQIIADQASEVGIELDIQRITWNSWLSDVYTDRNFQATTSSYLALYYPDVSFYKFLHPDGAFFFTGWSNDEYNQLVEDARHMYDTQARAEKYQRATEILHEERAGHLMLFWQANLYGSQPNYKGRKGAPDGSTLRFHDNYFDDN
ncbi:ABC transporter substrate-binding protein [Haloarchaeobius sp. HRN-SO-5]|uniref:ABC transporter substrate-binding protein n=1 Tax=Haloarchaeobius sp. HRN-SO-5 TaxID=3446118 RepID=UPI003EBCBD09